MDNDKILKESNIEEIYSKLEKEILTIPGVVEFTGGGFQNIVQEISKVIGKRMCKGILINYKKGFIDVNISISIKSGFMILELGNEIQRKVKEILNGYTDNIENINYQIGEIYETQIFQRICIRSTIC